MTNKETVNRNIGLAFDFLREVISKPQLLDQIPDNSVIEFVEKDFPKTEKTKTDNTRKKYIIVKNEFELI
jgi:hypothetical protein